MPQALSRSRGSRNALALGILLGAILWANGAITVLAGTSIGGIVTVVLCLAAYFIVGLWAGQRSGTTAAGANAGALVALVSSALNGVGMTIIAAAFASTLRHRFEQAVAKAGLAASIHQANTTVITSVLFELVVGAIVALIVGAGVGALGAMVGRGRATAIPLSAQRAAR
jgi:hypothetical protein